MPRNGQNGQNMDGNLMEEFEVLEAPVIQATDFMNKDVEVKQFDNEQARKNALLDARVQVADIDNFLSNKDYDYKTDKERLEGETEKSKIGVVKERQLSNIFINSTKRKDDSKEMKAVKNGLLRVEQALAQQRPKEGNRTRPVTGEELLNLENVYMGAIEAAKTYLFNRLDKKPNEKINNVKEVIQRLIKEQALLAQVRMRMNSGDLTPDDLRVDKTTDLLVMADIYKQMPSFVRKNGAQQENVHPLEQPVLSTAEQKEGSVASLKKYLRPLFKLITGAGSFAEAYRGVNLKDAKQKSSLQTLVGALSKIKQGVAYVDNFFFYDEIAQIKQDEDNRLSIVIQGQNFKIPGTTNDLLAKLGTTMIDNAEKLGTDKLDRLLMNFDISDESQTRITDLRLTHDLSVKVLEKFGKFPKPFFNNIPTQTIRTLAVHLLNGDMSKDEIKDFVDVQNQEYETKALGRKYDLTMVYFLMSDSVIQDRILDQYKKRENTDSKNAGIVANTNIYERAVNSLNERGEDVNKQSIFGEIIRGLDTRMLDYETITLETYVNGKYKLSSKDFDGVPNAMLRIFLEEHAGEDSVNIEEVSKLREVCKDAGFKQQMQNNMHDLELDILVKRDEMAGKIRVTGLKKPEEKRKQAEDRKKAEASNEKLKEVMESGEGFFHELKVANAITAAQVESKKVEADREKQKELTQKFMADIFFSKDTWTEDGAELDPGERLKRVLADNSPAIAYLLKEYLSQKVKKKKPGDEEAISIPLLKETIERIPIAGDADGSDMGSVLEETITRMIDSIAKQQIGDDENSGLAYAKLNQIPYANMEAELNKRFSEDNPALLAKFSEAEANINKMIDKATDAIQEKFNEVQGIKFDEKGDIVIEEAENSERVDRPSNHKAIRHEIKLRKLENDFLTKAAKVRTPFANLEKPEGMTEDKDKFAALKAFLNENPGIKAYIGEPDEAKPYAEEYKRLHDKYLNGSAFFRNQGDYVNGLVIREENLMGPAKVFTDELESNKTASHGKLSKALYRENENDQDWLVNTPAMKASATACNITNTARALIEVDTKNEQALQKAYALFDRSWWDFANMLPYKSIAVVSDIKARVSEQVRQSLRMEDDVPVEVTDREKMVEALNMVIDYVEPLTHLKSDADTVYKLKNSQDPEEVSQRELAEESFKTNFREMEKSFIEGKMKTNLDKLIAPATREIGREFLTPFFEDTANHGEELRTAYEDFISKTAVFKEKENLFLRKYQAKYLDDAIKNNDPEEKALVEEIKALEPAYFQARRDFANVYYKVLENRLKIRAWEAEGNSLKEAEAAEAGKKLTASEGRKKLTKIVETAASGNEGQGLFVKLVMGRYFKNMSTMDKRSMIASALRNTKKKTEVNGKLMDDPDEDVQASFISGYLKGAGPLFQKMMQGVPDSALPEEFKQALSDMKSNLSHIPEDVVNSRLSALVAESEGKIENIEVVRSLGAASVGETFLCKIYEKGVEVPKEAVVKILRPEVKNRMEREKQFMLDCARKTSKGMELTYLGKLKNIEEELDFTLEASNVEAGEVYNKPFGKNAEADDVEAMKLSKLVKPSSNVMLLEKAEGNTLNKYMDETNAMHDGLLSKNIKRDGFGVASYRVDPDTHTVLRLQGGDLEEGEEERKKLIDRISALKKRKQHLITLSKKWTYEGIFGKGFYHADLHSGNIQVNDDKATVLDFGNCTKLTGGQQDSIIRMMISAVQGYWETFRDEFLKLMTDTPEEFINAHKEELSNMIKKVFSYGDESDAALRITAVLAEASKIGFEIPRAINDFADGALRLQNSVDSVDNAIDMLKNDVKEMDTKFLSENEGNVQFDMVSKFYRETKNMDNAFKKPHILRTMFQIGMTREMVAEDLDNMDAHSFRMKYMSGVSAVCEDMLDYYSENYDLDEIKQLLPQYLEQKINTVLTFVSEERRNELIKKGKEIIAGKRNVKEFKAFLDELTNADELEVALTAYQNVKNDESKTAKEKADARETFLDTYMQKGKERYVDQEEAESLKDSQLDAFSSVFTLNKDDLENDERNKKVAGVDTAKARAERSVRELKPFFEDEQYGEQLRRIYDEMTEIYNREVTAIKAGGEAEQADSQRFDELNGTFVDLANKVNLKRLNKLANTRIDDGEALRKDYGCFQVAMGQTIKSRMWSTMFKMGIGKTITIGAKVAWKRITGSEDIM